MKENGKLAVDTNAIIAYRKGEAEVCEIFEEADFLLIPVAVLGELLYGAMNSNRPVDNELVVKKFLEQASLIPINESIAFRYSAVRYQLKKIGRPIPENDIWIAASCLELNVSLVSKDTHFEFVEGLQITNWEKTS